MKRKQSGEDAKTNKSKRKKQFLYFNREIHVSDFDKVKTMSTVYIAVKIKSCQSYKYQSRTTHQQQSKFHGTVFFFAAAPDADEQEFRYHSNFKKKEKRKEVE